MKTIATIAAMIAIAFCGAQTNPPLANARSYSDTTTKPTQSIMRITYPPLKSTISPMPTPTLNLPKAKVVNSVVIIPLPRRAKKKKSPIFD